MRKKGLIWGIMSLLSVGFVHAQAQYVPQSIKDFLRWLFLQLPIEARAAESVAVALLKFILFVMVFAFMYSGARKIPAFADKKNIITVIALTLSLMSVILIPGSVVLFLFGEFSSVVAVLLALMPIIVGIYIRQKVKKAGIPYLGCIILLLVAVTLLSVGSFFVDVSEKGYHLFDKEGDFYGFSGQWCLLGGALATVLGILCFMFQFGYGKHDDSYKQPAPWSTPDSHKPHKPDDPNDPNNPNGPNNPPNPDDPNDPRNKWRPVIIKVDPPTSEIKGRVEEY